jgi:predicted RNA-binding protein Jag
MDAESIAIKDNAIKMAWYMRGGASYEDVLNMSSEERKIISKLIEENLDITKKSGLPFF